ncbi:hypothetical protein HGQ17_08660 [Nesterenkonia sp. MY13]|uniref:Uncharacterized protein n=1 Tax=Nesterenkonia sedimenti TaxID=1463632 RepID=A0A7X8TJY0_9MICC|nr:hypothetical protein [Nesterenkonia sedimenti]
MAVAGERRKEELSLNDLDSGLQELAIQAVEAMPGLDMASVTLAVATLESAEGAILERVNHHPHLREFSRGSRREAQRLAERFVTDAAEERGFSLPPAQESRALRIRFTGAAAPERLGLGINEFADSLGLTRPDGDARIIPDGAELNIEGRPSDIAMLVTRAGIGLADGESAHMVETFDMAE